MASLIEQTSLSGTIGFLPYRHLLDVCLTQERFRISFFHRDLLDVAVSSIIEVRLHQGVWSSGFTLKYQATPTVQKVVFIKTRRTKAWAEQFAVAHVTIRSTAQKYHDHFLDYFRQ